MQQLYTSAEAARLLGISDGTIRSWLSRHGELFEVGNHILEEGGKRLWTQSGLEVLRRRAEEIAAENAVKDAADSDAKATEIAMNNAANSATGATEIAIENAANIDTRATETATQHAANNDAHLPPHFAMLDGYLDQTAAALAERFWQQLPERTMQHIQQMMRSPSPQQQEIFKQSLQQSLQLLPTSEGKYPALPQAESYSLQ